MKNRAAGIAVVVSAVLLLGVILSFKFHIEQIVQEQIKERGGVCIVEGKCLHDKNAMPLQTYGGIIIGSALLAFGIYLLIFGEKPEHEKPPAKFVKQDYGKALKSLGANEKSVLQCVIDADGTIFQSEIVESTGFTKVKVTRILDALEGKGLIERRRRGMTNVIILKPMQAKR